jgi:predicted LPLAT superfamily acyltransferase
MKSRSLNEKWLQLAVWLSLLVGALLIPAICSAADLNEDLIEAARKSDAEKVKALLAKGADVNAKTRYGATALSFASDRGSLEVVKVLIEHGADVNVKDTFYQATPLVWAISRNHAGIVTLLLDKGAKDQETALMMAAGDGSDDLVKVLASRQGLKPEHYNKAIQAAVKSENLETARVIIAAIPPSQLQAKNPAKLDAAKLKTYSGAYKGAKSIAYVFAVNNGNLIGYSMEPVALMTLESSGDGFTWMGQSVRFDEKDGKVSSVTIGSSTFQKAEQK